MDKHMNIEDAARQLVDISLTYRMRIDDNGAYIVITDDQLLSFVKKWSYIKQTYDKKIITRENYDNLMEEIYKQARIKEEIRLTKAKENKKIIKQ